MKKILCLCLCLVLLVGTLASCGTSTRSDKPSVVVTIFPEYDWVREILAEQGSDVEVTTLINSGVDFHSFQPTAADMVKIARCDLFIYVGGESDKWVEAALAQTPKEDRIVINLMEVLGDKIKEETTPEGGESEEEHGGDGEEEEIEYDEHVWLSLRNAVTLCRAIAEALGQIMPDKAEVLLGNEKKYEEKLTALDAEYEKTVKEASRKTLLFADRFPFRYMADDYGLTCYAAFSGCSAESEASAETIYRLGSKLAENNLPVVLTLEQNDGKMAGAIIAQSGLSDVKVLAMNSLQVATKQMISDGFTYLSAMQDNLSVLKTALY